MSHKILHTIAYSMLAGTVATALLLPRGLSIEASVATPVTDVAVQVELVMLVDTSGSVDNTEYMMQRQGYADAFRDPSLTALVENRGGIAVLYVEFSDPDHHPVRIPWTRLDSLADCEDYALEIEALTRDGSGETAIAPAIEFAVAEMQSNGYRALRRLIDVSGDGRGENYDHYHGDGVDDPSLDWGTPWNDVISSTSGKIDQINGICITTDPDVVGFFTDILAQGTGAFALQVNDFDEFKAAILEKLVREIGSAPPVYD